jgi:cytochrome P450
VDTVEPGRGIRRDPRGFIAALARACDPRIPVTHSKVMAAMRARRPPGPSYWTPFAPGRAIRRDPIGFVSALARDYGDAVCLGMGPVDAYLFHHPDAVKHILQDNNQNYVKGEIIGRVKVLIGEGLFTSEGDFWRRQRRLAQPAFHRERIAGLAGTMVRRTAERLDAWQPAMRRGAPIDVAAEMNALTLTIVGETLFGRDLSGEAADAGRALRVALEVCANRAMSYFVLPVWVPTARNRALRAALRTLDGLVYDIIDGRRRSGETGDDLLGMLMSVRDEETGEGMSRGQLRDEVMTFLLAGHETTAVALAWTWYLLALNPDVAERARTETLAVLGDRDPALDDLPRLPLARMVVEEAMRLYPPVWGIGRQAIAADEIGGYDVPAGAIVNLSPWVTHRHPAFWDEPDRFDPERFRPGVERTRPRFAYFPFSGGPRLCIGEQFALMEAQLIVAMMLRRYRLLLVDRTAVVPEPTLTLRPRGGLAMRAAAIESAPGVRRVG